jgi:hypothetical protein
MSHGSACGHVGIRPSVRCGVVPSEHTDPDTHALGALSALRHPLPAVSRGTHAFRVFLVYRALLPAICLFQILALVTCGVGVCSGGAVFWDLCVVRLYGRDVDWHACVHTCMSASAYVHLCTYAEIIDVFLWVVRMHACIKACMRDGQSQVM